MKKVSKGIAFIGLLFASSIQAQNNQGNDSAEISAISAVEWQSIQAQITSRGNVNIPDNAVLSGALAQTNYIKGRELLVGDNFGFNLNLSGDLMVVGAPLDDSAGVDNGGNPLEERLTDSGAAYVFRRENNSWRMEAYLKASNPGAGDRFGVDVDVDGSLIVIGANAEDSSTPGVNSESNNSATNAGAAYVFEFINGSWKEVAYLKASNPDPEDAFGNSVAISGRTVVVGAFLEDSSGFGVDSTPDNSTDAAGAAYIFSEIDGQWSQQAFLKASNTELGDEFGHAVAIFNDTVVVSAFREDSGSVVINGFQGNSSGSLFNGFGAVYVFQRQGNRWEQQAYLKPPELDRVDRFGSSVAIFEDTIVVGTSEEDSDASLVNGDFFNNNAINSGAAYVFRRNRANTWFYSGYIKAENSGAGDEFGISVDVSSEFIVVGARFEDGANNVANGEDNNDVENSGAAYVYQFIDNDIELVSVLKSSSPDISDAFGSSVSVSGNGVLVGAPFEDSDTIVINGDQSNNDALDTGAAFLFNPVSVFHTLSGTINGLSEGNQVSLINEGGDTITIDSNGFFRFPGIFAEGETFNVTIAEDGQPVNPHQVCEVINGEGVLTEGNVGSIRVNCTLFTLSINTNINTVNQALVSVPVQLAPEGMEISTLSFRLDYDEQCLNPDTNGDGVLDQVTFDVDDAFTTFVDFDTARTDGEIGIIISDITPPISMLEASNVVTLGFIVDCPVAQEDSFEASELKLIEASFADASAEAVLATVNDGAARVWASFVGDCNVSGSDALDAADFGALVLEIADDDGTNYLDAPESDNFGSPQGCDANGNLEINVADISCMANLIFGDECEPLRTPLLTKPELNISTRFEEDIVWFQTKIFNNGNNVAALSYDLVLDPLIFNPRTVDFNNDGIPDRINNVAAPNSLIRWNDDTHRLRVLLFTAGGQNATNIPFDDGLLIEVGIPRASMPDSGFSIAKAPHVVFADGLGNELEGVSSVGDVIFADAFE